MGDRYRVTYPGNVRKSFRRIYARAEVLGIDADVASAAQAIEMHLKADPQSFGDPAYSLPFSRRPVYIRGWNPLVVHYAVYETEKLVIVKNIDWLPPPP